MSIFSRNKGTGASAIEAEVAALEKRHTALSTKLAAAEQALEAARTARRAHLIDGAEDDAAASAKHETAVTAAERDVSALQDALTELDARLADSRKRLVAAKEAAEREAEAAKREAAAKKVEEISAKLDSAVDAVARLFDELVAVIPAGAAQVYETGQGPRPATPYEAARQIVAEGLHKAGDGLFELVGKRAIGTTIDVKLPLRYLRRDGVLDAGIPKNDDSVSFLHASGAADRIVVSPLRKVADEIRDGRVAADAMRPAPKRTPLEPSLPPLVRAYVLKELAYRNFRGDVDTVAIGDTCLPQPAFDRALALGLAVTPEDPRAAEHRQASRRRPDVEMRFQTHLKPEPPIDLAVDIKSILDVERERLNEYREAAE